MGGGGSCSDGHGFESQHHILDGHFSHLFVAKIVMFVWKDENKWKRGWGRPIFYYTKHTSTNTIPQFSMSCGHPRRSQMSTQIFEQTVTDWLNRTAKYQKNIIPSGSLLSRFVLPTEGREDQRQCDQIGRFLKVLGDQFSYISSPNV